VFVLTDNATGTAYAWIKPTFATDSALDNINCQLYWNGAGDGSMSSEVNVWADGSNQVAHKDTGTSSVVIATIGYRDLRGMG
jgi:chitinase